MRKRESERERERERERKRDREKALASFGTEICRLSVQYDLHTGVPRSSETAPPQEPSRFLGIILL